MSEREAYWRNLVHEHESSELGVSDFCAWHGVSTASFYQWRKRLRNASANAPMFVPVSIVGETTDVSSAAIEIALPNGCVVRVVDGVRGETLAVALAAAGELSC